VVTEIGDTLTESEFAKVREIGGLVSPGRAPRCGDRVLHPGCGGPLDPLVDRLPGASLRADPQAARGSPLEIVPTAITKDGVAGDAAAGFTQYQLAALHGSTHALPQFAFNRRQAAIEAYVAVGFAPHRRYFSRLAGHPRGTRLRRSQVAARRPARPVRLRLLAPTRFRQGAVALAHPFAKL
jgi:hypothetical protein